VHVREDSRSSPKYRNTVQRPRSIHHLTAIIRIVRNFSRKYETIIKLKLLVGLLSSRKKLWLEIEYFHYKCADKNSHDERLPGNRYRRVANGATFWAFKISRPLISETFEKVTSKVKYIRTYMRRIYKFFVVITIIRFIVAFSSLSRSIFEKSITLNSYII